MPQFSESFSEFLVGSRPPKYYKILENIESVVLIVGGEARALREGKQVPHVGLPADRRRAERGGAGRVGREPGHRADFSPGLTSVPANQFQ